MLRLPLRQTSKLLTVRRIALKRSLPVTVCISRRNASTNASIPDEAASQTPEVINALLAANQHFVETFHGAGLPWWASIVTATVCLRSALTLPIAVYQQRAIGRMIEVAPIVQSWGETLKNQLAREGKAKGWEYERYNMELQKQVCGFGWKVFRIQYYDIDCSSSIEQRSNKSTHKMIANRSRASCSRGFRSLYLFACHSVFEAWLCHQRSWIVFLLEDLDGLPI
jgi:hypothetical protein